MKALTSESKHFLCTKKERVSERETKIPVDLDRWEQGKKEFLKFMEKHFAGTTWKSCASWVTIFVPNVALLLRISIFLFFLIFLLSVSLTGNFSSDKRSIKQIPWSKW